MGVAEDEVLSRVFAQFRDMASEYFSLHAIGILYQGRGRNKFNVGSGFVATIDGMTFLVTAGHVCEDLAQLATDGQLERFRLCYFCERRGLEWYDFPTTIPQVHWDDSDFPADIGTVSLANELLQRLRQLGVGSARCRCKTL